MSGSSGRLVVERIAAADAAPAYPGQVFAYPDHDYAEAMQAFVAASQAGGADGGSATTARAAPSADERQRARAVRRAQADLRAQRRQVRQRRTQEDAAWRVLRAQRQQQRRPPAPTRRGHRRQADAKSAHWRALRAQRRQQRAARMHEDAAWRAARQIMREQLPSSAVITAWIAILVIIDNCTRQCLGVPLFVAGARVTADMVVTALRALLPVELQFLISDRGVHFTAQVFQQLATDQGFIHVVIARHRPQSNGIAERFVRTLKEWLADKVWTSDQELTALLAQFRAAYNDRPHQGIGIPGLSPNEFAGRIWLL